MAVLANTRDHFVEFEAGCLWITRRSDGLTTAMKGDRISGDFRSCIKSHGPKRAVATYISLADQAGCHWNKIYKKVPS